MKLREERIRRGWSLTELTRRTGIATSDLSQIERGLRFAHPGWRRRIARALELPESQLFASIQPSEGAGESGSVRNARSGRDWQE